MIYKMIGICDSRHKKDAACNYPPPSRCNGCLCQCSKYDRLMLSTVQCQKRKSETENANNE